MSLPRKSFGKTGLELPPLVFGATSLGNLFRVVTDDEKTAIVQAWQGSGLQPCVIDTAGKYGAGMSLEVIGRELSKLNVPADSVVISNKLAWRRVPLTGSEPTFEPGAWFGLDHDAVQDISYDGILRCWHEGNELLGSYRAQLVSVHDPDEYLAAATDAEDRKSRMTDLVDAYRALSELKAAGEVAGVGVGAKDWNAIHELAQHCDLDWAMFANSLTIMRHPPELCEFMSELGTKGVAIINSAVFHGGFLLGGEFFDYRKVDPDAPQDKRLLEWRKEFVQLCHEYSVSPFDVGVGFGLSHPAVTAIALSSSRGERVQSHIDAVAATIPPELWTALKERQLVRSDLDFV